ncbi:MAG: chitobiase/beta-hexosaminidase C-terminal domain-containing protein, partial [Pirellulales bacterium]
RLRRDFHTTPDGTFLVDLPTGSYDVRLTLGDAARTRDQVAIHLQGTLVDTVTTLAGEYATRTFTAEIGEPTGGQFALRLEDLGGETARAAIDALMITPRDGGVEQRFDFGTTGSPVEPSFTAITTTSIYSEAIGYGWQAGTVVSSQDRGVDQDELHTNFKLSAKGETIGLVSPEGAVVSQFGIDGEDYPPQVSDVSYGITDQGTRYFAVPTPGAANTAGQVGLVGATQVSVDRGFFDAPFQVELTSETPGATIRYTTDGSEPTETEGTVATGPITVAGTTVLRAAAFKPDYVPGAVTTRTYLFLQDVLTQSPDGEVPAGFPEGPVSGNTLNYGMDPDIVNDPVWGPQLIEALTSIPTMSIVTDAGNLFDPVTGIYVNPAGRGKAWERPISVELLNPDGSLGFQVDAGLRIRGGFSRSTGNPKHALRLFFRREYGAAELNFPLFGDEGVDRFQSVDLRTAQNYSWSFGGDVRNTFLRDVFSRDTQGALGQPYTRSRFYHLYINGQYWGMYQTQERAEADYAASYFGGDKEDYDVVKPAGGTKFIEVTDGNLAAYDRLYEATVQGFSDDADYFRIQGMNPDGTRNPDFERLLDADNLIDYMLITYYTGDKDGPGSRFTSGRPNNFFAILNREAPDGFKWFEHDSEHSL